MLLYQTTLVSPQQQRELIVFGSFSYLLVDFSSSLYKAVALRLCRYTEGIGRLLFSIVYHRGISPTVATTAGKPLSSACKLTSGLSSGSHLGLLLFPAWIHSFLWR